MHKCVGCVVDPIFLVGGACVRSSWNHFRFLCVVVVERRITLIVCRGPALYCHTNFAVWSSKPGEIGLLWCQWAKSIPPLDASAHACSDLMYRAACPLKLCFVTRSWRFCANLFLAKMDVDSLSGMFPFSVSYRSYSATHALRKMSISTVLCVVD